jgi:hypothetical protein
VVPDYKKEVEIIYNDQDAAQRIREVVTGGGVAAFDYETNRKKPDISGSQIFCCAVYWRGRVFSYPMVGEAVKATAEFVASESVKKIGANNKFEDRWSRRVLKTPVVGWLWDTVLSAHHLDNREGITAVKFQALVRLGLPRWTKSVDGYLEADDGNGFNQIHKVDSRSLLTYCGIDSLVEFKIAELQRQEMKEGCRGFEEICR